MKTVKGYEVEYKTLDPDLIGAKNLRRQQINAPYDSQRDGRRSVFISSDIELRVRAIAWYKTQVRIAKDAWKDYHYGLQGELPPGFYGPGGIYRADLVFFMDMNHF